MSYPQWHNPGEKRYLIYEVVDGSDRGQSFAAYGWELRGYLGDAADLTNPYRPPGPYWRFTLETNKSGFDEDLAALVPAEDHFQGLELRLVSVCPLEN